MAVPMFVCIKWLNSTFATALYLGLFIWLFPMAMNMLFVSVSGALPEGFVTAAVAICFLVIMLAGGVFGIYFILRSGFEDSILARKYAACFVGYVVAVNVLLAVIF